ncbi:hypothetical protein M9435_004631 [Picochlorum sp. BPE23]|nr:hypothetical protein M9435_004631 [Picochlorum sp. BPE23]
MSLSFLSCSLLIVASSLIDSSVGKQLPRGVSPEDAALYRQGASHGKFTCKDGSVTIPFNRVNDDYCDCADGSDEPGTSACLNGVFYCRNKGHEVKILKSMYVDDGVCDCCDGSDEPAGVCPNSCREIGEEALKELEKDLNDAKSGLAKRSGLEKMAATTIKSWEKRLEQLEEMESSKAQQKAAAEVRKNQSEAKLERLRKSLTRLEEAAASKSKKEEVPVAESQDTPVDEDDVPLEDVDEDVPLEDIEDMHPEDVHGAEEEEEDIYEEETEEERAKRVASQWIPGEHANTETVGEEDAYEAPYEAPDETVTTETPPVESSVEEEEIINEEVVEPTVEADDRMDLISRIKVWVSQMIARATGKVDLEQDLVVTKAKVEAAQKQFDSANQEFFTKSSELSTLQNEKGTLTSKLGTNYGTRNVFLQLSENCVEATIDKYVYEVCPFGDAHQSEGGRKTKLGTWKGFEGDTMVFTDGEGCWQGPSRSINVTLKCGSEDSFVSLAEPSRCTYTGVIRTPAHCTDELVKNLEREVERKKTLLQEYNVKDEL